MKRSFKLVIWGAPVTKKNHQQIATNKATGRPFVTQATTLKKWADEAAAQLRSQWLGCNPITEPVNMAAVVYRERATGDLLNYLAAISDVLEAPTAKQKAKSRRKPWPKASIIVNDRQVVTVDGSRLAKDKEHPRVEIELTLLGE